MNTRSCLLVGALMFAMALSITAQINDDRYVMTVTRGDAEIGTIELELWPDVAPKHVAFVEARINEGFYNGTAFHRVIPNFMIQGGDPNSKDQPRNTWGYGGHSQTVDAEFNAKKHLRGVMSAARTDDPNSFSGQFFICVKAAPWLDGQYTTFGEVVSGMNIVDTIVNAPRDGNDNPLVKISMTIARKVTSVNDDAAHRTLTVSPMPAHDRLHVNIEQAGDLALVDLIGNVVLHTSVDVGTTTLDLSSIADGLFTLVLRNAQGVVSRTVVVARR